MILQFPGSRNIYSSVCLLLTVFSGFLFFFPLSKISAETPTGEKFISYVKNPNGMFLYPDYRDKKNRVFVPYQTRLLKSEKYITVKISDSHSEYFYRLSFSEQLTLSKTSASRQQ